MVSGVVGRGDEVRGVFVRAALRAGVALAHVTPLRGGAGRRECLSSTTIPPVTSVTPITSVISVTSVTSQ